ncbi:hypothetical protein OPKNFCMD_1945 [Methylobacterium crusticola]|uniref:UrcA family protein n=3 Tax=Methylobacterium crusticola TaxID=1697972 RepID=A0ABQ4QV42_9HYPH|nr:hypothetical protein OPKNFCMD_1945 [Methylobacterium crusticola]
MRAAATILLLLASPAPARAQTADGPLRLRIHPNGASATPGDGPALDAAEIARAALAAREAFEARVTARARRAVASVCTGCLAPEPAATGALPAPAPGPGAAPAP